MFILFLMILFRVIVLFVFSVLALLAAKNWFSKIIALLRFFVTQAGAWNIVFSICGFSVALPKSLHGVLSGPDILYILCGGLINFGFIRSGRMQFMDTPESMEMFVFSFFRLAFIYDSLVFLFLSIII